jgi:hypothetical protein
MADQEQRTVTATADASPWHRSPVAVTLFALLALLVLFCAGFLFRQPDDQAIPAAAGAMPAPPSAEVRAIQQDLRVLNFYDRDVTGEWNDATITALMDFQRWAGLKADGLWEPRTQAALQAALDNGDQRPGLEFSAGR